MAEIQPTQMNVFGLMRGTGRGAKLICGYDGDIVIGDTITVPGVKFCHFAGLQTVEDHGADSPLPLIQSAVGVGVSSITITLDGVDIDAATTAGYAGYIMLVVS